MKIRRVDLSDYRELEAEMRVLNECPAGAQMEPHFGVRFRTGQEAGTIRIAVDIATITGKCVNCRRCRKGCREEMMSRLMDYVEIGT